MSDYVVVVADGARARFFSLEEAPIGEGGPNLIEHEDLVNPEAEMAGRELYTDEKSGRNKAPGGGPAHGYDDHRERHNEEIEQRFAKNVAAEAVQRVKRHGAVKLILVADKRMLGMLRSALSPDGFRVAEVPKDLSKLKPHALHEYLAGEKLIPARKPAMV